MKDFFSRSRIVLALFIFASLSYIFFSLNSANLVNALEDAIFTNLNSDGELSLKFDETKNIEIENDSYTMESCYSYYGDTISTRVENNHCTVTANDYGRVNLTIRYSNGIDVLSKDVVVDIESDIYLSKVLDTLPNEVTLNNVSDSDIYTYLGSNIPSKVEYESRLQDCKIIKKDRICPVIIRMGTTGGDSSSSKVLEKTKNITFKAKKTPDIYVSNIDVSEKTKININNNNGVDLKDYILVSSDNTVATVSSNGIVAGKMPGVAEIRLYNKITFDYSSATITVKKQVMSKEEFIDYFKENKQIDIDFNNNYVWYSYNDGKYEFSYESIINSYFREYFDKTSSSSDYLYYDMNTTCDKNKCKINYTISENGNSINASTGELTVNIVGIKVSDMVLAKGNYYDLKSFATSADNSNILVNVDSSFFEYDSDNNRYKVLKTGKTKVEYISESGYKTTYEVDITYSQDDLQNLEEYIDNTKAITLPYRSEEFNQYPQLLNNIVKTEYMKLLPKSNPISKQLIVNASCVFQGVCNIDLKIFRKDKQSYYHTFNKTVKIIYEGLSQYNNTVSQIKDIDSKIKDKTVLTLEDTVFLENTTTNEDDLYTHLIDKSGILLNETENIKLQATKINNTSLNNYIKGSTTYKLSFIKDEEVLYEKEITVFANYIIDATTLDSNLEEDKIRFIKEKINKILSKDVDVSLIEGNYYKITNNGKTFNVILDQKEKINISSVSLLDNYLEMNINDEEKILYRTYPDFATIGEIRFKSNNEKVATVSSAGTIHAVGKGSTTIEVSVGYSTAYLTVLVDEKIDVLLNNLIDQMKSNFTISYSSLNNEYVDDVLISSIENEIRNEYNSKYNKYINNVQINVYRKNDKYYMKMFIIKDYQNNIRVESKEKEITYGLKGIRVKDNKVSLKKDERYNMQLYFSDGDLDNLIIENSNKDIISVSKKGVITALKPGVSHIDIYDKYNLYYNNVIVYVDKDNYFNNLVNDAKKEPIVLYGKDYVQNSYSSEIPQPMKNKINDLFRNAISEKLNLYSFYTTSIVDCNLKNSTCTIQLKDSYNGDVVRKETFNYKLEGVFLEEKEHKISTGEEYTFDYKVYPDLSTVEIKSLDSEICSVNNNKVIGIKSGVCPVTLTSNGNTTYQFMIVDEDKIIENIQKDLDKVPNTINLKADKYDSNIYEEYDDRSYEYKTLYNTQIISEIEKYVKLPNNYDTYYEIDLDDMQEKDTTEVVMHVSYQFEKDIWYNYNFTFSKKFDHTYESVPQDKIELGNKIVNKIPREYELTLLQIMRFKMDNANFMDALKYSSLENDIKLQCPECTYIVDKGLGMGGMGSPDFFANSYSIAIYKDGYPIGSKLFDVIGRFNVTLEDSLTDEKVLIEMIKEEVKDAYIKLKDLLKPKARMMRAYSNTKSQDDIEVDVTKEYNDDGSSYYNIKVEEIEFKANIGTTVSENVNVTYTKSPIKSIKLDKEKLLLLPNNEDELIPIIDAETEDYDKTIEWISSNPDIVEVDENGRVVAKNIGTATITALTSNGLLATCEIEVNNFLKGDMNNDKIVDIYDIMEILYIVTGKKEKTSSSIKIGDMNDDKDIDIFDAMEILYIYTGKKNG